MTILGQHTVDETQHLMKTVEFRLGRAENLVNKLPFSNENRVLVQDWNAFNERWANARKRAHDLMLAKKVSFPLATADVIPAEEIWKVIRKAINVGGEDTFTDTDLSGIIGRLEKATGQRLNEEGNPMPEGFDPDFEGYKKVDAAIRKVESAVPDVPSLPDSLSKPLIPTWVWVTGAALGVGVVGAVGYSIVRTGQKTFGQMKKDEAYIRGEMLPKVLPGYKPT